MSLYPMTTESTLEDMAVCPDLGEPAMTALTTLPLDLAACSNHPDPDQWVPDFELAQIPSTLMRTCQSCPIQEQCLRWASLEEETGYWGGATSAQRTQLMRSGEISLDALAALKKPREATHPAGKGSEWRYAQGCRCEECTSIHRILRARQRAERKNGAK